MTRTSARTQVQQAEDLICWLAMKTEAKPETELASWTTSREAFMAYQAFTRNCGGLPYARTRFLAVLLQKHGIPERKIMGTPCLPLTLVDCQQSF